MRIIKVDKANRIILFLLFCIVALTSCNNSDYLNSIPSSATALIKFDTSAISGDKASGLLKKMLPVENVASCGLDISSKVYAFETVDGNFGLCLKVSDSGKLKDTFDEIASKGKCSKPTEQGDLCLFDIDNAWKAGFSDHAMIVLGPVSAASLSDAGRRVARMLRQDEESSIVARPMFSKLDSIYSPVAMVAQVQALPEKFVAPFTIGVPKDADASQVLVAASFSMKDGVVCMEGETFSFSKSIDNELKKANAIYRTTNDMYVKRMPADCLLGLFTNVDGKAFLPMLQQNKSLQTLLAGINTAIDFDNILRGVDGNIAIMTTGIGSDNMNLTMYATTSSTAWTADVDYWKKSCPAGNSITGSNGSWSYNSGSMCLAFGLVGNEFYATTDNRLNPVANSGKFPTPVPERVKSIVSGKRMAMVLNISALQSLDGVPAGLTDIVKSVVGDVNAIVYVMK